MQKMKIDILGTKYTITIVPREKDKWLENLDGYCDRTTKSIVVCDMQNGCNLDDKVNYIKTVKRHEIIHAFLNESGLADSWTHKPTGHEETVVDWFAIQFPKIMKAYKDADCL